MGDTIPAMLLLLLLLLLVQVQALVRSAPARRVRREPPPRSAVAASARWLASSADLGVLAGVDVGEGFPFATPVAFSDGEGSHVDRGNATGVPFFFLTDMDPLTRLLRKRPRAAFAVSGKWDSVDGRCGALDVQEPTCARLTLSGVVKPVVDPKERDLAKRALWSKHPAMDRWPDSHDFNFYKLDVTRVFFLNDYGGAHPISVKEYFAVTLDGNSDDTTNNVVLVDSS